MSFFQSINRKKGFTIAKINPDDYRNDLEIDAQIDEIIAKVNDKTVTNMALKQAGIIEVNHLTPLLDALANHMPNTDHSKTRNEFNRGFELWIQQQSKYQIHYCQITPNLVGNPNLIKQQAHDDSIEHDVDYPEQVDLQRFIKAVNQFAH